MKKITEKQLFVASLVLFLMIISVTLVLQHATNSYLQKDEFYELSVTSAARNLNIESGNLHIYHFILIGAIYLLGVQIANVVVPLVIGLVLFFVLYSLLRRFVENQVKRLCIFFLLFSAPPFVYLFTNFSRHSVGILGFFLGVHLILQKKWIYSILAVFALYTLTMISLYFLLPVILMLYLLLRMNSDLKSHIFFVSGAVFVLTAAYHASVAIFFNNYLRSLVIDFGVPFGLSLFAILLVLFHHFFDEKHIKRNYGVYVFLIILLVFGFIFGSVITGYLVFPVSILAGLGLYRLLRRKWNLPLIRLLSAMVIVFGLLISVSTMFNQSFSPLKVSDYEILQELAFDDGNVLSSPNLRFAVEYYANKPVFPRNTLGVDVTNVKSKEDYEQILTSRDIEITKYLLKKHEIKAIVVSPSLRTAVGDNSGLIFLLKDPDTFKKRRVSGLLEIWDVK